MNGECMSILTFILRVSRCLRRQIQGRHDNSKRVRVNFSTGQLTGQIVEGKEAIKVWIWCCLQTQRFRYPIYSWDYGADMEQYIGRAVSREFLQTDCEDEIRSAMLVNPYISDVTDFNVERKDDQMHISFRVITRFGEMEVEQSV